MIRTLLALALGATLCPAPAAAGQHAAQPRRAAAPQARAAARPAAVDVTAEPAQLFPATTIFYAEVQDVDSALEQLGGVDVLYRSLASLMQANPVGRAPKMPVTLEQFRQALGSRLAIGVMPKPGRAGAGRSAFPEPTAAIVIQAPSAELMGVLRKAAADAEAAKPAAQRDVPQAISGMSVLVGRAGADPTAYVFSGDTLVVGPVSGVRALLGSAAGPAPKLAADAGYISGVSRAAGRHTVFAYVNGRSVAKLVNDGITSSMESAPAKGAKAAPKRSAAAVAVRRFLGMDALAGITMTGAVEGGELRVQTAVEVDRTRPGLVTVLSDPPAIALRSAAFMPDDVDAYVALSVDTARIYDLFMEVATAAAARDLGAPPPAEGIRAAEAELGMSVRNEIIPAFGTEIAFAFSDSRVAAQDDAPVMTNEDIGAGGAPPPAVGSGHFYGAAEVRDGAVVRRLVEAVGRKSGAAVDVSEREGATVFTQGTSKWAIAGGYLLFGDGADVERMLEARGAGKALLSSARFTAAAGSVAGDTVAALYLAPSAFDDIVKKQAGPLFGTLPVDENPFPNGLYGALRKDGSGVFNEIRLPAGPAWKAFLDALDDASGAPKAPEPAPPPSN